MRNDLKKCGVNVWQGADGRWYAHVPALEKHKGRKLVSRKTRDELEKALDVDARVKVLAKTFGVVFETWQDRRLELKQIAPGTYTRMQTDYNRYMTPLTKKRMDRLTKEDYLDFMEEIIAREEMNHKAVARVKTLIKGTVNFAKRCGYADYSGADVLAELQAMEIRPKQTVKEDCEEVFSDDEMAKLMGYLEENPDDANNALYLIFLTGMRVGECVALKHSDIVENTVSVKKTETSYTMDGVFYREVKDSPKTAAGFRTIVVPTSYQWFLDILARQNYGEEYIFKGSQGSRLSINYVERRLKTVCQKLGMQPRSPHKIRKTYCSILLDNGLDQNFIKSQVGHTDIWCTENYYHRNRKDISQKTALINSVPEFGVVRLRQKHG